MVVSLCIKSTTRGAGFRQIRVDVYTWLLCQGFCLLIYKFRRVGGIYNIHPFFQFAFVFKIKNENVEIIFSLLLMRNRVMAIRNGSDCELLQTCVYLYRERMGYFSIWIFRCVRPLSGHRIFIFRVRYSINNDVCKSGPSLTRDVSLASPSVRRVYSHSIRRLLDGREEDFIHKSL